MTQSTYDVSFSGVLLEGSDLSQVKNSVAKLFKTDIQKIEVMFSGNRVVIKRDQTQQTALKYQAAMKQIGAICDVTEKKPEALIEEPQKYSAENPPPIPLPTSTASPQSVPIQPTENTTSVSDSQQGTHLTGEDTNTKTDDMSSVTIAPPGETIIEHEQITEPEIDISAISIDESKGNLAEHMKVPEPQIDVSSISMDNSGGDLVQYEKIAEPEFDISAISMDDTGVDLTTAKKNPPLEVDISNLRLASSDSNVLDDEGNPG